MIFYLYILIFFFILVFMTVNLKFFKGKIKKLFSLLSIVGKEIRKDKCFIRASSLAYSSLLAIVPLFALVFALCRASYSKNTSHARWLSIFNGFFTNHSLLRDNSSLGSSFASQSPARPYNWCIVVGNTCPINAQGYCSEKLNLILKHKRRC